MDGEELAYSREYLDIIDAVYNRFIFSMVAKLYFNIYTLLVGLFYGLFLSNKLKMAEPIGPKRCVGSYMTPGKVYGWSTFQKYASNKNLSLNLENHRNYFYKISEIFIVVLQCIQRENVLNRRWTWNALKASSIIQTKCCVRIKKMHMV